MPFIRTTTLPSTPLAVVTLRGLLLIKPGAAGAPCIVGVQRLAASHYLTIAITAKPPTGAESVVEFLAGPLFGRHFSIRFEPASGAGVFAFLPDLRYPEPFNRNPAQNDDNDLRWIIDFQSHEFHQGALLDMDPAGAHPGLSIHDGIFFTAMRTQEDEVLIRREGGGMGTLDLLSITHVAGVALAPPAGSHVLVEWQDRGVPRSLRLRRPEDPEGTTYEIYVRNDPPKFLAAVGHNELAHYYDVIRQGGTSIGAGSQFTLEAHPAPPKFLPLRTTDRVPCIPATLGL